MQKKIDKYVRIPICVMLAAVTVAVFWPVKSHEFINYDDPGYVTENPRVIGGLSIDSVKWAFTEAHNNMWHPLTTLSHIFDCELYGLNPAGHHATNLLLHIANTLLLFTVLRMMTNSIWKAAFVAALFALHPLQVESVAWVAERKNVLSGFFWLLTIAVYIRYTRTPSFGRYIAVLAFCVMALMSKPIAVTLPFTLLLLDFWPLNRFRFSGGNKALYSRVNTKIILEKVPMFFFSAAVCVITFIVQRAGGAVQTGSGFSFGIRLANAVVSYLRYIFKVIYPAKLAVFYPHPNDSLPFWQPAVCVVVLAGITAAVVYWGRRNRYLVTGWLWYLGILVPVIGIIQAGSQAMADRYMYLPSIGLFIMLAWGIDELVSRRRYFQPLVCALSVIWITLLIAVTRMQLSYWHNAVELFSRAVQVTENNYVAYNNLGSAYSKLGRFQDAFELCRKAVKIKPDFAESYNNLGVAYGKLGRYQEAIKSCRKAIELEPNYAETHNNLGAACMQIGLYEEAIESYKQAIRLKPSLAGAHSNLGFVYGITGRYQEAMRACKQAIKFNPSDAEAHYNLAIAYLLTGDKISLLEEYEILKKLDAEKANKLFSLLKNENNF